MLWAVVQKSVHSELPILELTGDEQNQFYNLNEVFEIIDEQINQP